MTAAPINRRGACPALTAPMQTGDGLLVRLNPVSQGLTPHQMAGLCESAVRHGNGIVEVTARGSFQIRGLTTASATAVAAEVNRLAIVARTGVPVETGPLAGIDPDEIADPRPLAEAIRAGIAREGLSARLAPKVSVIVDGGGAFGLGEIAADVRLETVRSAPQPTWRVALGGTAEAAACVGEMGEDEAVRAALDFLGRIAALGPVARGRDLVHASKNTPTPNPSPQGGGELGGSAPESPSPLWGGVRGGGINTKESGNVGRDGIIPLRDSRLALPIALPFGSMHAGAFASLTQSAAELGVTEFRLASGRMLIALVPAAAQIPPLRARADALGFVTDLADPRLSISACPGAPACVSGLAETRPIAAELARNPRLVAAAGHIHVSGCAKGCAHPAAAPLTLVGGENGLGLVVNGTARDKPCAYLEPAEAAKRLAALSRLDPAGLAAEFNRKRA